MLTPSYSVQQVGFRCFRARTPPAPRRRSGACHVYMDLHGAQVALARGPLWERACRKGANMARACSKLRVKPTNRGPSRFPRAPCRCQRRQGTLNREHRRTLFHRR
jgi:hypothetical protein